MRFVKNLIVSSCFACLLFGCATTPHTSERQAVSYDGNTQNGGIIGWLKDGSLEITSQKALQYQALIAAYGSKTTPPTKKGFGLALLRNGHYSLSCQGAERFYALILIADRQKFHGAK